MKKAGTLLFLLFPCFSLLATECCPHFLSGIDFLWWQPSDGAIESADVVTQENVLGVAAATSGQPTIEKKFQKWHYSPGFRINLGWQQGRWDAMLDWVWYYNKSTQSLSATPDSSPNTNTGLSGTENGAGIYGVWLGEWIPMNVSVAIDEVPVQLVHPGPFAQAKTTSRIHYDTVDAEIGYTYKTSLNSIRFLFGVRTAVIDRSTHANYCGYANLGSLLTLPPTINGFSKGSYKGKLNFWGLGPRLGFYDAFSPFCNGFSLFGEVSTALLYGPMHGKETISLYDLEFSVPSLFGGSIDKAPRQWVSVGNLQALIGLGWHCAFKCFDFDIHAAWESNMWFMPSLRTSIYPTQANLTLNGLTLGVQFSY